MIFSLVGSKANYFENEVLTFKNCHLLILQVYSKVSGEQAPETPTIDVSSKEFYGEGYDDSDKRIPDMTIINRQLGKVLIHCVWFHDKSD